MLLSMVCLKYQIVKMLTFVLQQDFILFTMNMFICSFDFTITSLSLSSHYSQHVRDVYTSPGGIFCAVQAGSLLIDCSTIDRDSAIAMSELAKEKNTQYIDAPVSGGN